MTKEAPDTKDTKPPDINRLPRETPHFVTPMNALLVDKLPASGEWAYEIKWDGYRALSVKSGKTVELYSRRGRPLTGEFPSIAKALRSLSLKSCVLDGELVALDEQGRSSFQLMQNYRDDSNGGLFYYIFDILNWEGRDLKGLTLIERKAILQRALEGVADPIRFSATLTGDPRKLLELAREQGLEGLIGKRLECEYSPGRRSGAWIKIKVTNEQEFVIGGYTQPQGSRPYFGAVLVGYYENGKLLFASKIGTGYDMASLASLYKIFQKYKTEKCPFVNLPTRRPGRSGGGIGPAEMRRCTWVRPELVAQVKFTEWTEDGGIRHPVFMGLRDDKKPGDVVRERPASA